MAVDPNLPSVIYYGARYYTATSNGLWKSTSSAASWSKVTSFTNFGDIQDKDGDGNSYELAESVGLPFVVFDKASGSLGSATPVIYVGVATTVNTGNKVYFTPDAGATWQPIANQPATALIPIRAALTPDGSTLYITYSNNAGPYGASSGAVYKVTNPSSGAAAWTLVSPTSHPYSGIAIDPANPNVIYAAAFDKHPDEIYRSTNAGGSWTSLNVGAHLNNSSAPYANSMGFYNSPHWLTDLKIDPFNNDVAMFNTGYGIYRTSNLTAAEPNWTFFNEGFEQSAVLELASPNAGSVHLLSAIGDRDGYRHLDFSQSPLIGLHGQNNGMNRGTSDDIDVAFNDANYVVRLVRSSPWVQYSNDNGVTWSWLSSTGTSGSSSGGGNLAISADGTKVVYEPGGTGRVRYATRTGSTWSSWTSTGITNQPANGAKIVADTAEAQTFYAYVGTTVSRSTNGGASWTVMTGSAPSGGNWIRAVPGLAGHLVMSRNSGGVWRSTDGGANWAQLGGGATVANQVGVGAGPAGGSYPSIYIGGTVNGQTGFFRSDDQGASWTMISDLAHQFGYVTVIQGDPRVHGRLYVGANGRGILVGDIHTGATTLPAGWAAQDIGSPGSVGAAGGSAGTFELVGGGAGVAGAADQFHFAYQTLGGDGTITAKVVDVPNGTPGNYLAKAGVMIRSSLASNSANAFIALTPGSVNGVLFQTRSTSGASTSTVASATTNIWPPYWVRLTRAGDQFTASISPDGVTWTQLGSPQTIAMGSNVFVGLAVTASNNNQLNISRFQNVSVVPTDSIAPTVSTSEFRYQTAPNQLKFKFSEDVSASLSEAALVVTPVGGGAAVAATFAGFDNATLTATFNLPTPLPDGDYQARLVAAEIEDLAGNALAADHVMAFFFMSGDADHDRDVDIGDLGILASHWQQPGTFADGDFDYSGTVDITDLGILASKWQMSLPQPAAPLASPLRSRARGARRLSDDVLGRA